MNQEILGGEPLKGYIKKERIGEIPAEVLKAIEGTTELLAKAKAHLELLKNKFDTIGSITKKEENDAYGFITALKASPEKKYSLGESGVLADIDDTTSKLAIMLNEFDNLSKTIH